MVRGGVKTIAVASDGTTVASTVPLEGDSHGSSTLEFNAAVLVDKTMASLALWEGPSHGSPSVVVDAIGRVFDSKGGDLAQCVVECSCGTP